MNQKDYESNNNADNINLGRYFRLLLLQSKLIIFITLIGFFSGLSIYLITEKTYKVSSLLQIYSPTPRYDPRQLIDIDFFNANETNIDNLITLYNSRSNILNLINSLNLNLNIENSNDNEFIDFEIFNLNNEIESDEKVFYFQSENRNFNLFDEQKNLVINGRNGEYLKNDLLEIKINFSNLDSEKLIKITYKNPSDLYNYYKNKIKVQNSSNRPNLRSQEGLLEIYLITEDIAKGKGIINAANQIFISDSIKVETEKAKKSISFINTQLNSLEDVLDSRKSELRSFKQQNKSLNVNLEVESIIELITNLEQKINKVDLDLSQAEINFTKENPLYKNLKIQKDALEFQKNTIEEKIENLPTAQQEYIDLFRNLEVSEELYSELVNRKLNFSLIEASTIGNIRVVDKAFVENLVSPKLSLILFLSIFSLIIGLTVALFRGIFFLSISNPAELKDAEISENIIGVIPKIDKSKNAFDDNRFEQSIETSILNIENIIKSNTDLKISDTKKVLITSATAENGKSFISRNISEGLARIGNKVLLIDADLKRGDLHKEFGKNTIELDLFKSIAKDTIEEFKVKENLYLIPRLKKLKNTFEYLYGNLFIEKIDELSNSFDYVVIDTAPALSVSDTGLLMNISDSNFLIVRHQVNKIHEIKQTLQIINQIGKSFDGIIYNDYQKPSGYYGYYDLYGDYSYRYYAERYSYEYYDQEEDD